MSFLLNLKCQTKLPIKAMKEPVTDDVYDSADDLFIGRGFQSPVRHIEF